MPINLYNIISESTCGEACWEAQEDICRCSCYGKNHGVSKAGQKPERTRKISGWMYQLLAVEVAGASCKAAGESPLVKQKRNIVQSAIDSGQWLYYNFDRTPGYPAKLITATASEVSRWAELSGHRGGPWRPTVLWVRCDLI